MEKPNAKSDRKRFRDENLPENGDGDLLREVQFRIMRRSCRIPEDGRISVQLIREYEWSANWADVLINELEGDSVYPSDSGLPLPELHSPEEIILRYHADNQLAIADSGQSLAMDERIRIVDRMRHYRLECIDHSFLDAVFDACNWVVVESITEENCLKELASAEDSVQRAELYMMMGNDVEAYREFRKISQEEISNPENALALVSLVERYETSKAALKILKRWFLLEIVLHPLPFDLVSDLIHDRKKSEISPRIRYLQSILLNAHTMTQDELNRHLVLVLPRKALHVPELADVNRRLKWFGLSMDRLNLMLDDTMPINLCTMMATLTDQLVHFADLAKNTNNVRLAVKALERAVLSNFLVLNLPNPLPEEAFDSEDQDLGMTRQMVLDNLDDIEDLLDDVLSFVDADGKFTVLIREIEALRRLITHQKTAGMLKDSDGMPGMSRKYDRH
ncbi:MAG TPA: hypothetical protein PLV45_13005 [bacterium]|nr:hypothetical protein [bacterium]